MNNDENAAFSISLTTAEFDKLRNIWCDKNKGVLEFVKHASLHVPTNARKKIGLGTYMFRILEQLSELLVIESD